MAIELNGKIIEVGEEGFILHLDDWSKELAIILAKAEDIIELKEDHWKVINFLRDYYQEHGINPMVRKLCKDTGFSMKEIYQLFSSSPIKVACKIAGLKKPKGCV